MSWIETFSFVMRSNLSTLKERVANPERMLHQLIIDMDEELERVRASVATALADQIQLERQIAKTDEDCTLWERRATSSLERGDESSARLALEQKMMAAQRLEGLRTELVQQRQQTDSLRSAVQELEDKIRQARQKQALLLARLNRAESTSRIHRTLEHVHGKSAFAEFSRLEAKVERQEAMCEAYARLDGKDPQAEELARKIQAQERKQELEQELEELKRRVRPATS
ncbi:MAG: PspA/IM30 family protein [Pirellulaceae bacterium]